MKLLALFLVVLAIGQTLTFPTSDDGAETSNPAGEEILPPTNSDDDKILHQILNGYGDYLNLLEQRSGTQPEVTDEEESLINEQSYQTAAVINDHPYGVVHDQTGPRSNQCCDQSLWCGP